MKNVFFFIGIIFFIGCQTSNKPTSEAKISSLDTSKTLTTIAFGSCNKQDAPQPIWDEVVAQSPDLWIWLGDNIYGDTEDMTEMKAKYEEQLQNENYQKLVAQTPIIGIWDDHDYGKNDAGKEYAKKVESKKLMLDFLNVPKNAPVRKREGAYQSYTFGKKGQKVKVILLDARYFRDDLKKSTDGKRRYEVNETGDILGAAQWTWLEQELSDESIELFIIGSGIQVIAEDHGYEKWANFPTARRRLLELMNTQKPKGVVFLSGDRHIAEISRIQLTQLDYPIYDITASGLTHSYEKVGNEFNRHRVDYKITGQKNFGILKIDWKATPIKVEVEVRGLNNTVHFSEKLITE